MQVMSPSRTSVRSRWLLVAGGILGLVALAFGLRGADAAFHGLDHARELTASLRVQLSKADDASNRAVMADTDEASHVFAGQAEQATALLEHDMAQLRAVLRKLELKRELDALDAFQGHWSKYRKLDREILTLAVENTNIKAQRLSFGPSREAANSFRDALANVSATVPPQERCRAEAAVDHAVLAVREIQILQAPHIAEADDAAMTQLEQEMTTLQARAREALATLTQSAEPSTRPHLTNAVSALDRFQEVSAQIVDLSRRNSNVRSLTLALRERPALAVACDDSLQGLQEALAKERYKATR